MAFPGDSVVKHRPDNTGDITVTDLILGSGRSPGGGNDNAFQYYCWKIPWTRSLAGQSPGGHKESDTTDRHNWTGGIHYSTCRDSGLRSSDSVFVIISYHLEM